jgi:competence protein ComEA
MSRRLIRGYFEFNKQQKIAVVLITTLLTIGITISSIYRSIEPKVEAEKYSYLEEAKDSLLAIGKVDSQITVDSLFYFDPNTISKKDLIKLGFKSKTAQTLINFRVYKRFEKAEDISSIYGLKEELRLKITPYVRIKPSRINAKPKTSESKSVEVVRIEINTADSSEWVKLRGIGAVLAVRIIKYRNALGGFYSTNQLDEIYGIGEGYLDQIKAQCYLVKPDLKLIKINKWEYRELIGHPYMSKDQVKQILQLRREVGSLESYNELKEQKIFSLEELKKIKPYLSFSQ